MQLEHFSLDEFKCKHCGKVLMKEEFLSMLDKARDLADVPFVITSGYRCEKHNRNVGGTPNSSHIKGYAADIATRNSADRFKIVFGLIMAGFRRIGIGEDFVHVDNDPEKPSGVVWTYYKKKK
ncbi:peptidase M15 [Deferribacter autotrophicus]|uniref:Peptidase M15 n=1 Tax=Deferribacter autotrophicus TaxID=500465 RepID=A0A5A8F1F7_9BACT|nr:D-Ala-D-Ala carboxypeptidase family metallohydrolase [Deferribacter autotrophicus]KAA0257221.1 peptidase M15 [Deferribacter autotrophicus]